MLPEIGFMVGAYIITRMTSLLTRTEQGTESMIARIFASITILVTGLVVLDLFLRGAKLTP